MKGPVAPSTDANGAILVGYKVAALGAMRDGAELRNTEENNDGWVDTANVGDRNNVGDADGKRDCTKSGINDSVAISVTDALGLADKVLNIEGDNDRGTNTTGDADTDGATDGA